MNPDKALLIARNALVDDILLILSRPGRRRRRRRLSFHKRAALSSAIANHVLRTLAVLQLPGASQSKAIDPLQTAAPILKAARSRRRNVGDDSTRLE